MIKGEKEAAAGGRGGQTTNIFYAERKVLK